MAKLDLKIDFEHLIDTPKFALSKSFGVFIVGMSRHSILLSRNCTLCIIETCRLHTTLWHTRPVFYLSLIKASSNETRSFISVTEALLICRLKYRPMWCTWNILHVMLHLKYPYWLRVIICMKLHMTKLSFSFTFIQTLTWLYMINVIPAKAYLMIISCCNSMVCYGYIRQRH